MATATASGAAGPKLNHIGLPIVEYRGGKSTLCAGCGHNAISERIIDAMFEMGVEPERVMKMSGIGCSSKSPAYFMSRSFSFNSVHGRMPSITTGAVLANSTMKALGISGDKKQLLAMLKAAIAHNGTVMLDVISPCVTFNDHEGSTKSYKFLQENDEPINEIGFVASFDDIEVDYDSGEVYDVEMHDGSQLRLRKLLEDYDPTDKANAVRTLMEAQEKNEILTGVFYIDTQKPTFIDQLNVVDEPLGTLPESLTRPPKSALESLMANLQ